MQYTFAQRTEHVRNAQRLLDNTIGGPVDWPGIFDEQMAVRVRNAQRALGLPITGIIDFETWDTLVAAQPTDTAAQPLRPYLPAPLSRGDTGDTVELLQVVLIALSKRFWNLPAPHFTGVYDEETIQTVSRIQRAGGLPVTGKTDLITWNHIAGLYFAHNQRR